jgi:hypothetical protein
MIFLESLIKNQRRKIVNQSDLFNPFRVDLGHILLTSDFIGGYCN